MSIVSAPKLSVYIIAYNEADKIEAALKSGCFDRVIVSTDDSEIADVSQEWGADVPFIRPSELSNDYIGTVPVIRNAIEWFEEQGFQVDFDRDTLIEYLLEKLEGNGARGVQRVIERYFSQPLVAQMLVGHDIHWKPMQ